MRRRDTLALQLFSTFDVRKFSHRISPIINYETSCLWSKMSDFHETKRMCLRSDERCKTHDGGKEEILKNKQEDVFVDSDQSVVSLESSAFENYDWSSHPTTSVVVGKNINRKKNIREVFVVSSSSSDDDDDDFSVSQYVKQIQMINNDSSAVVNANDCLSIVNERESVMLKLLKKNASKRNAKFNRNRKIDEKKGKGMNDTTNWLIY